MKINLGEIKVIRLPDGGTQKVAIVGLTDDQVRYIAASKVTDRRAAEQTQAMPVSEMARAEFEGVIVP